MEFVLNHPDEGTKNIVILFDGVPYEANSDHPWWDEIVYGAFDDDPRILDLIPIRSVQQPSQEIPNPRNPSEDELLDALTVFHVSRDLNPLAMRPEDYSEEDIKLLRRLYDRYDQPVCDNLNCLFCHGPRT